MLLLPPRFGKTQPLLSPATRGLWGRRGRGVEVTSPGGREVSLEMQTPARSGRTHPVAAQARGVHRPRWFSRCNLSTRSGPTPGSPERPWDCGGRALLALLLREL